jgi:hypothetical protein
MKDGKNIIFIIISVIVLIVIGISVSYSYFLVTSAGKDNIISVGDLDVSFCEDETCKKNYPNFGKVIGTKTVNGESVLENIYPYPSDAEALNKDPYIFNISNHGSLDTNITVKLVEDKDYKPTNDREMYIKLTDLYSNYIKIAVSNCDNGIDRLNPTILNYGSLNNNIIIENDTIEKGKNKTYCLWTYLDSNNPNEVQNTYFDANLNFKEEYLPQNGN